MTPARSVVGIRMAAMALLAAGGRIDASADAGMAAKGDAKAKTTAEVKAATPEEAVAALAAASKTRDLDGVLGVFPEAARPVIVKMIGAVERFNAGNAALKKAAKEKSIRLNFLIEGPEEMNFLNNMRRAFSVMEVVGKPDITGDNAVFEVKNAVVSPNGKIDEYRKDTWQAVREKGQWRVVPARLGQARLERTARMADAMADILGELADGIREGKLRTAQDVDMAWKTMEERIRHVERSGTKAEPGK